MKTYLTLEIVHNEALPELFSDALQERAYTYLHNKGIRCVVREAASLEERLREFAAMREERR
jgi:hypothetical protein